MATENKTSTVIDINEATSLTPKLRFKEFERDWDFDKMRTITSYVDYRGRAPEKSDNGIFLVTAKNIKKGYIDYDKSKEYVKEENYKTVMSKGLPKIGDVLFTTEAPLGNIAQVDKPNIALAQRVIKLRGKEFIDNTYLLHYMLAPIYQKLINRKAIGTTVQGISGKELHQTKVCYPKLPEQQKIATFLTAVDTKIQQLNSKKSALETFKKGAMQQLFSQKIRFKADDGSDFADWEEKTLNEVAKFRRGSFPQPYGLAKWYDKEGMPFVQVYDVGENMLLKQKTKQYISEAAQEKSVFVEKGTLVLTIQGSIGRIAKTQYNSYVDRTLLIFQSYRVNIDVDYFKYIVYLLFEIEKIKAPGGTIKTITKEKLSSFTVNIPPLKEQQKIANYLSAIDVKIESVQQQIKKTQAFKKGLLQQLFV